MNVRFYFDNSGLFRIQYTPSLKEYIRKLEKVTRQGIYACAYKTYDYLCAELNIDNDATESSDRRTVYDVDRKRATVAIDKDNESVSIILEAMHE